MEDKAQNSIAPQEMLTANMYRHLAESCPVAMLLVSSTGTILYANPEACRLFLIDNNVLEGSPLENLIPERYRKGHAKLRLHYQQGATRRAMGSNRALFALRSDGVEVPVEVGLNPIRTEHGQFVLSTIIDVTERKRAESRFQLAVESALNAMVMVDQAGTIVFSNTRTAEMFGYTSEELNGQPIEILVPARFRRHHPEKRASFSNAPASRPMGADRDLYAVRADGSEMPVEVGLNPICSNGAVYTLCSIVDITERKRNQELQAIHSLQLEQSNRALAAAKADLERAVHTLQQNNKDLDEFVHIASHDLKSPLRGIGQLAQWVIEDEGDALSMEGRQNLATMQQRVTRMGQLLDDLLAYSKALRVHPVVTSVDVGALVLDIVSLLAPADGFEVTVGPNLPTIHAERPAVEVVLTNLIGNALKHHDRDTGTVHVRCLSVDSDMVELEVTDDGPGILQRYHDQIFLPFRTLRRRDETETTGVGLALVKKLVETRGGSILVESAGRGTSFRFTWPRSAIVAAPDPSA